MSRDVGKDMCSRGTHGHVTALLPDLAANDTQGFENYKTEAGTFLRYGAA